MKPHAPELDAFMREFLDATQSNPFAAHERVWEMRAAFELSIFDNRIHLGCVRSLMQRGKGNGTAALDWLCALADRHGVEIEGEIEPVGQIRPRLNAHQLRAWYKRHGFTVSNTGFITRKPKGAK